MRTKWFPAGGVFNLGWAPSTFYLISAIGGGIGGALAGGRCFIPGLIGGVVAGPGTLYAVGMYLGSVSVSHSAMMALCGLLGALPGILIGLLLKRMQVGGGPVVPTDANPPAA